MDLDGAQDRAVGSRVLADALTDLLDLELFERPPWLMDLIDELAGHDTESGRRFACPCCERPTLTRAPDNTHERCPVCGWVDHAPQLHDADEERGPNPVTLNQARENFRRLGASES